MNEIKVSVNFKTGECRAYDYEPINNDYNVSKLGFNFDEEYTGRKVVEIRPVGDSKNATFSSEIIDNEVVLVKEENGQNKSIFTKAGQHVIEVHLYNDGSKITATGTRPFNVKEEQINIGDSQATVYLPVFDQMIQELDSGLDDLSSGLSSLNEAITETNNLDLDVSKSGKVATVTLTKKDGTTTTVTLSDGTNLMFNWNGTRLGIKTDSDSDYTYVDLQGIQGEKGDTGAPFTVKKTYATIQAMVADYDNMQLNDYVMISGNVEQEDNAKLFTKTETEDPTYRWQYLADFSGATGIQGETGLTPNIQIGQVVSGDTPGVTRSGTNENPVLNFTLVRGARGETGATGATGATGNGISSIAKTGTSGLVDTYTITFTNNNTTTFTVTNGKGISSISKTGTSGLVDTYTITYNDGTTSTFEVTNSNLSSILEILGLDTDDYDSSETYSIDDIVVYNHFIYKSKVDNNTGNLPTNTTYWEFVPLLTDEEE